MEFYNLFTTVGIIGLFGCVYFYFCLPETENKTLQEISEFFKQNQTLNTYNVFFYDLQSW